MRSNLGLILVCACLATNALQLRAQLLFPGRLDEAPIARRAMTHDEVRAHMDGGIPRILSVEPKRKLPTVWATLRAFPAQHH